MRAWPAPRSSRRGAAPGGRRGTGLPPHRPGWSRAAREVAPDGTAVHDGGCGLAACRGDRAGAGRPVRAAVVAYGLVGCRSRAGRPHRSVHAVGASGVGQPTGRDARPGRTRARRPPPGAGERGTAEALPRPGRRHAQGAFRRRRDVRRDRRGGRCPGPTRPRR